MMILQFYLKGLLISAIFVLLVGGFYAFTYLVRNTKNHGLKEEIEFLI